MARHRGFFEQAHASPLFLDEIGDLPLAAQRVLLHVLEEDRLTHIGGKASIRVDVRIIAATHRDLRQAVREGTFREDLYYRDGCGRGGAAAHCGGAGADEWDGLRGSGTARLLGMSHQTLRYRMRKYGIQRPKKSA